MSLGKYVDQLKKMTPFSRLTEDELHRLMKSAEIIRYKRNAVVYVAHDPSDRIYVICDGRVKLSRSCVEDREIVLEILVVGEMFGEVVICGEGLRSHSAVALEDSLLCAVKRQDFEYVIKTNTGLLLQLLCHAGIRCAELELRLEDQIFLPVEQRLLLTLLRQAVRLGERYADGSINIHLTQKDLAHLIGASRETVAEILAAYKEKGILETGYRTIKLVDLRGLAAALPKEGDGGSREAQQCLSWVAGQ